VYSQEAYASGSKTEIPFVLFGPMLPATPWFSFRHVFLEKQSKIPRALDGKFPRGKHMIGPLWYPMFRQELVF
jgi:hypothetical protein